jgi:mono/diheme cytochrome c family protein
MIQVLAASFLMVAADGSAKAATAELYKTHCQSCHMGIRRSSP